VSSSDRSNLVDHFGVLEVKGSGALHPDLQSYKVQNPDEVKIPLGSQPLLSALEFRTSGFEGCRDRNSRQQGSWNRETRSPSSAKGTILLR
jgi:hypothetical protein